MMNEADYINLLKAKADQSEVVSFPSAYKPNIYRSPVFTAVLITALITTSVSAYFNPEFRQWIKATASKAYFKVVSFIEFDYSFHEAEAMVARGLSARSKGQYNESINMLKQAMARYVNKGNAAGIAVAHVEMGILYTVTKQYALAKDHLEQASLYYHREDDPDGMAYAHINMGKLHFSQNQFDLAAKSYKQAEEFYKESRNSEGLGNISRALGTLSIAQNNYPDAIRYFADAESWYKKAGSNRGLVLIYTALSNLFKKQGNHKVSRQFNERARAVKLNGSSSDLPEFSIRKNFRWLTSMFKDNQNAYQVELNRKAKQETERVGR